MVCDYFIITVSFKNLLRKSGFKYLMDTGICVCVCMCVRLVKMFVVILCVCECVICFLPNRLSSLPDVFSPHHWLSNGSLPRMSLCTCAAVGVCASMRVCRCSRSHPSCSVARLIGGIWVSLKRVSA